MSNKKTKQKKASNITKELQGFIEKKEKQNIEPTKVNVQNLLELIPDVKINKRRDNYIKFYEANCYIKDMTYGIQFRESISGAPTGKLTRIETPEQMQNIAETIKQRIKNYIPINKPLTKLDVNNEVGIIVKLATRNRIKKLQNAGESYDRFLNRMLDRMEH